MGARSRRQCFVLAAAATCGASAMLDVVGCSDDAASSGVDSSDGGRTSRSTDGSGTDDAVTDAGANETGHDGDADAGAEAGCPRCPIVLASGLWFDFFLHRGAVADANALYAVLVQNAAFKTHRLTLAPPTDTLFASGDPERMTASSDTVFTAKDGLAALQKSDGGVTFLTPVGLGYPNYVWYDAANDRLVWATRRTTVDGGGAIGVIGLDGGGSSTFATTSSPIRAAGFDGTAVYVVEARAADAGGPGAITRIDPTPTSKEIVTGVDPALVDVDDAHVYFCDSGKLRRVPKDGSGAAENIAVALGCLRVLVDATHVYWEDGVIWRALKTASATPERFMEKPACLNGDLTLVAQNATTIFASGYSVSGPSCSFIGMRPK